MKTWSRFWWLLLAVMTPCVSNSYYGDHALNRSEQRLDAALQYSTASTLTTSKKVGLFVLWCECSKYMWHNGKGQTEIISSHTMLQLIDLANLQWQYNSSRWMQLINILCSHVHCSLLQDNHLFSCMNDALKLWVQNFPALMNISWCRAHSSLLL